jgi:hypothetical protein
MEQEMTKTMATWMTDFMQQSSRCFHATCQATMRSAASMWQRHPQALVQNALSNIKIGNHREIRKAFLFYMERA